MRIEIEIPDKDIPQRQDSIDIHMSFIDGKVCECDYPFATIVAEEKTKADVLDKIRAEIEQEYNCLNATRADETLELGECLGLKMALKIIDKYKAESEE